ncbi:MAG TPA: DUF2284 domain-containing protein [Syntrophales bacterium]|nr:DUF2284 domain-containing protein [Syntrophales bacterium]HOM06243.1 DUF2284 domain-containing protein [Syntrophales bacterium]HON99317.1 DUF2284 domain-containing protein [Syntrophales bacterium]HPC00142.1 DUF2284 domain-containing protein [Syntrophales bacterium]HPQ05775.1 DUF2284 domain-containing protein [Syntrophales bacterium]
MKTPGAGGGAAAVAEVLLAAGASAALPMAAADVVCDERVRLKCQIPICDSFRRNLTCPPFVMTVPEFRRALRRYREGVLIQVRAPAGASREEVFVPANRLHDLVNLGEREAFHRGYRFAAGLIGGCCRLCETCVAAEGSVACRHPFRARPSMEAVGIDVAATVERVGLRVPFPMGDTVVWTGLILLE